MLRTTLGVVCVLGLSGIGAGIPAGGDVSLGELQDQPAVAVGSITSVDLEEKLFVLMVDETEAMVTFDAETVFVLDLEESTAEEALQIGYGATVTHDDGHASRVEAVTPVDE
ncbi:MAG: hypothetical protein AAGI30_09575 [Planctomycetota bacterium]